MPIFTIKQTDNKYILKDSTGRARVCCCCFCLFFNETLERKKIEKSQLVLKMVEIQGSNLLQASAAFQTRKYR